MENLLVPRPISEYREFSRSFIRSEILLLERQEPRVHRRACSLVTPTVRIIRISQSDA